MAINPVKIIIESDSVHPRKIFRSKKRRKKRITRTTITLTTIYTGESYNEGISWWPHILRANYKIYFFEVNNYTMVYK